MISTIPTGVLANTGKIDPVSGLHLYTYVDSFGLTSDQRRTADLVTWNEEAVRAYLDLAFGLA